MDKPSVSCDLIGIRPFANGQQTAILGRQGAVQVPVGAVSLYTDRCKSRSCAACPEVIESAYAVFVRFIDAIEPRRKSVDQIRSVRDRAGKILPLVDRHPPRLGFH